MELTWVRCRLCERELDCYTFKGWISVQPCRCCRPKYRLFKWIRRVLMKKIRGR